MFAPFIALRRTTDEIELRMPLFIRMSPPDGTLHQLWSPLRMTSPDQNPSYLWDDWRAELREDWQCHELVLSSPHFGRDCCTIVVLGYAAHTLIDSVGRKSILMHGLYGVIGEASRPTTWKDPDTLSFVIITDPAPSTVKSSSNFRSIERPSSSSNDNGRHQ
jgi:hypothetical protein